MTRGIGYYTVVAVLLLACVFLLLAGIRRNQRVNLVRAEAAVNAPVNTANTAATAATGTSVTPNVRIVNPGKAKPASAPPTSLQLPEDIRLSDVNEVTTIGGQPVLMFRDGSRLPVTPDVRDRLPGDVQLRLTYTRDN